LFISFKQMAELAAGLVGAAATGSGFKGRHESSYREEVLDTRRSTDDFMKNRQSRKVASDEESNS